MGNSINLKDFIENISYNKNQTYTRVEVLDEISKFELLTIVNTLPTENIKTNKIYLVLNNKPTGNESVNRYDLYVYVNNKWEQIDSLELNIDDYYTKLNIDNLLNSKADYNHTHGLTTSNTDGFMSHYDKNKLDNIEDEANKTIVDNALNGTSSNPVENNVINTALGTKIDKESITDNLETNNSNNVLSAKQGKVLKDLVDNKTDIGHPHSASDVTDNSAYTNIGSSANSTQKAINNSINTKLGLKADSSDVYTKSETYSRTEIMSEIVNQISNITLFTVVTELPTTNIKPNKFYLVNNNKNKTENVYDIYVYVNNTWEKIDSLEFNLDDYYTKTETDTLLDGKVDTTDSRLTDSRNPKSHSHGNISNTGAIGSTARKPLITTTNGVVTTGEFGNSAGTFVEGNDSRLSDARTPVSHTHSKEEITDFPTSMTPSAHTHGAIQNGGTLNSDTTSANKVVVTDGSNNIKTVSKLPLDKVTHQDISGKAESNHTHGAVQNNGTLNSDTDSVNKIVVTDNNNNIKTISKLPNVNITEQDITGKVDKSDIQDNLTSTDGDKPLSANQGKILKGLVDGKANTTHSHNTGEVTDTSAYGNIGSSANSTQKTINNNINTKLGLKADSNNVYTKTQTLTATEITTAIAEGVSNVSLFEVVTTLPTTNIKGNKFYLKSNNENNTENLYDIYIYVNNKWEKIDSLEFDIDNYYTITQIDNLLNGKVNTTDSRLTDSSTPKSHSHGNLTNTGAIGSTANKPLITTTNGVVTTGEFGTTANTFVEGNDSRLSNARTPTSHTHGAIQNGGTLNSDTTTVGKVVVTDGSNNIKTISKLPSANVTHQDISGKVNTSDVKDNLTSTDTNKPLSAKQGKVLDEKISNIVSGNVDLSSNHQHDDRYYTESEIDTKLNGKANSSHTHSKSQITDFPTSITPTAHTDSNGAYGKATTSVWGHTKLSSATNSTDETMSATPKAVKTAYDLANGKSTVSVKQTKTSGIEIGSVTVNGTETKLYQQDNNTTYSNATTSANGLMSSTDKTNLDKTVNRYNGNFISGHASPTKPYLRLFNLKAKNSDSSSSHIIFEIIGNNNDRLYAKIRVDMRQNTSTSASTYSVTPLEVYGFNLDELYFGFRNAYPNTSLDIFRKVGAYVNFYIRYADDHTRDGTVTMYSPVVNSTESYTDLTEASTALYNASYTATSQGGTYGEVTNTIPYTNINANKFVKRGGTSGQFLKADGSVDSNTYLTTSSASSTYLSKTDASNTYQAKGNYLTSHNPVDTALSSTSTNAVQNKVINTALGNKVDKVSGKGLSTNDFTTTYKTALDNLNTTIANAVSNLEMIEVVTSLPTSNIKTNKLYLKANSVNGSENKYDFYVRVNNAWEKVDSLDFSISDYIKKDSNTNLLLSNGTTKAQSSFIANSTGSVTSNHIADKTIVNGDIADATIESGKIKNGAVTNEKLSGTKITASSSSIVDLNDATYQKTGFYYCDNDNYAPYIIHCPWSNGTATPYTGNKSFFLFVEDWGTNTYSCKQTLTYYNGNNTYTRTKTNSTTWTAWKEHNTNNNDYLRLATRVISGEAIVANNIIGGSNDSKYYKLKSGLVLDTRYPILFNTSAITSGSYTDNVYSSHTGVPLTNNVSGKTVTNQKQVYIEGTSYDGKLFTVSDRVFVSDDQINSTTDLGKYYIYIGVSYSTTNIRFNSFHQAVYVETRNGLVPVGDNTNNPHMLVKSDAGTAGYFKFLTIRTIGTYHDQTIEFDTTHRGNKPKTVVSFNFNTYEKTSGSKQYYTNIQAFYYRGHPTPVYYIQTNDGVQDATFDFYIRRETWDEMGVSDLRSSTNNYNGMTVTWHNDFVTALPTGTTQATLNPYYAQVGHTHGSITNNGQLNSDITSVNKVAVTDSSNNLKTINQLPYSKISGTPTIPTKTSQLTNDSNFTTATGHTHSYLPLSGGDITGRVSLPIARDSTNNNDNSNIPWAGTNNLSWDTDMWTTLKNRKSLMGTFSDGSKWWNVISNRHRNGNGDGTSYGMYLRTTLQDDGHLLWAKQKGSSSFMAERTILDSSNYSTYANKTTITNNLTTSTTGTALDASQGKWLYDNKLSNATGSVTSTHIADKTIVNGDIADNTIETGKIKDGTIVNGDIANTTITGGKLVNGTITATQLASNAVEEGKIKDGAVTTNKLGANAVTSAKIADGTIVNGDIANNTIEQSKMRVISANGGGNTAGYVKVIKIVLTGTYPDRPITFDMTQRHITAPQHFSIKFQTGNHTNYDAPLELFTYSGSDEWKSNHTGSAYIYKEGTATYSVLIQKSEAYDNIYIRNLISDVTATITYPNELLTNLPTSNITRATYICTYINGKLNFGSG